MNGWNGAFLNVNLTKLKAQVEKYPADLALNFLGGRGFAVELLWNRLSPGTDPLSPDNKLIFAAGPLTGIGLPNSGKLVVASKSPLTGGYGDGNIGTQAAVQMRKAGYDAIIIEGKAKTPVILHIKDALVEFVDAKDFWGLTAPAAEAKLRKSHTRQTGFISIGPAGENLVKFAAVVSQDGRAGGRPGMGAVMGSKNLKAIAIEGTYEIPLADPRDMQQLASDAYREILMKPIFPFWKRQGTMSTVEWSQANSVLPTYNFRQGTFDKAEEIGGYAMEKIKVSNRGCPQCNMTCGNVVTDSENKESELDYENVVMLGSNLGLGNLEEIATLNRMADELGFDSISLGNVIGFAMEASEKGLITEDIPWGNFQAIKKLIEDIAYRRGFGATLADGVRAASKVFGEESNNWAMHVKGLEVTAYDCHAAPGMALAYGTSSIGAHHKDAWIITWELKTERESYDEGKVDKIIDAQRIRGGVFEALGVCRFPNNSLGLELEWYHKFLRAATGYEISFKVLNNTADRILNLMRAFWIRECNGNWSRKMDYPPERWFNEPLTVGPLEGSKLDREQYDNMLNTYYEKKGWDQRGIPKKSTLINLGLKYVVKQLGQFVKLED